MLRVYVLCVSVLVRCMCCVCGLCWMHGTCIWFVCGVWRVCLYIYILCMCIYMFAVCLLCVGMCVVCVHVCVVCLCGVLSGVSDY